MTLKDRAKEIAAKAKERASSAGQDAQKRASEAEVNEEAVRRAKARAAAAARAAGSGGPQGSATPDVSGSASRTKQVFARAQQYATASAPVDVDMDPSPSGDDMWAFASAGNGGQPTGQRQERDAGGSDADWGDNPDHLDEPEEVRQDLRADGLDPMDVASQQEAQFGHFLVHAYADDPDMGGRSQQQLEAEHDMVVSALEEDGVDHDSPLDFDDPFGASASAGDGETEGGDWGWR